MPTTAHRSQPRQTNARPWKLLDCLPAQGEWSEDDYLALDSLTEESRTIELSDGTLEFLPPSTKTHQLIVAFLFEALRAFTKGKKIGEVYFSGRRIKLGNLQIRYPDIVFVAQEHVNRSEEQYVIIPDMVMEVVSSGKKDRDRDYQEKLCLYAHAGILEYWIIDPKTGVIQVLVLQGKEYMPHGKYRKGQQAGSYVLDGFEVDVSEVLAGAKM